MPIALRQLQDSLPKSSLFGGGAWLWSPEPFVLTHSEARFIRSLGHPLARFQSACDQIYRHSATGRLPAWICEKLDQGKPRWLVDWQRQASTVSQQPRIIRPDLILEEGGFALTELDSVPGGIGITAWLSQIYARSGYEVFGTSDGMIRGFQSILPDGGKVLISEESADYRPEMEWLCSQLGDRYRVVDAESFQLDHSHLYRFFELFDWESIPSAVEMAQLATQGDCHITPAFKAHLEDKLWLALFWTPGLGPVWRRLLRRSHLQRIRKIIPHGWIPDPSPLPDHASLPFLNVHSWQEIMDFSQARRRLVLKISGFDETAWGSRGVHIGHDMPATEWRQTIESALAMADSQPHILQEFREGRIVDHPFYESDGSVATMKGRVRLCPYYFTNISGHTTLGGCLATIAPADKKKIHGMRDAILVPCVIEQG